MPTPAPTLLRIGSWCLDTSSGQISGNGEASRLDARSLRLLLCLAQRPGEVVSIDDLIAQAWSGVAVSPDSVYQAITSLRRQLGDDPKQPSYIETVPRLGYRLVATVAPWTTTGSSTPLSPSLKPVLTWGAIGLLFLTLLVVFFFRSTIARHFRSVPAAAAPQSQKSIAVLPFLDLTEGMKEETFADGMTEELIDKLSKVPGLRVASPTSSFYFKGKQMPIADIAKSLGVSYVLDGSVRKSGNMVRVAARLVRADNTFVIWSETYDRPFTDLLMVQDDIANSVTKSLSSVVVGLQTRGFP